LLKSNCYWANCYIWFVTIWRYGKNQHPKFCRD
jgi:hypothetical protein